tara:strand:- start:662 stop:916 length:255 start_codon:yes stop_codon:yes gene_type:complete
MYYYRIKAGQDDTNFENQDCFQSFGHYYFEFSKEKSIVDLKKLIHKKVCESHDWPWVDPKYFKLKDLRTPEILKSKSPIEEIEE